MRAGSPRSQEGRFAGGVGAGRRPGAAVLDVLADEPPPESPPFRLDNVLLTPHAAWRTRETLERSLVVAVENCRRLRAGEALPHRVNG